MSRPQITWLAADDPAVAFPDVEDALAAPNGLLAAGGDLSTERLVAAYSNGIFPWFEDGQPILWWSPDPRCVIFPGEFHVSRRLRRQLRDSTADLSFNRAFGPVIRACAGRRRSQQGTWITSDMIAAYERLHEQGWAHSVEIRDRGELVGGLYGVCIGRVFFGESMFSREPNGSKMAMLGLTWHMQSAGIELLDCQVSSQHLLSLGARLLPRSEFTSLLHEHCSSAEKRDDWPESVMPVSRLFIA